MAKDRFGYGREEKPNWNDLGRDHKLDVIKQIGQYMLQEIPKNSKEYKFLTSDKNKVYDIAQSMIDGVDGDIDKAGIKVKEFIKMIQENQ